MTLQEFISDLKKSPQATFYHFGVYAQAYHLQPKSTFWNVVMTNSLGIVEPAKRHAVATGLTLDQARRKVSYLNAMERELCKYQTEAADLERAIVKVQASHRGYALHLTRQLTTLRKRARRVPAWVGQRMDATPRQFPKLVYVVVGNNGEEL